MQIKTTMRHHLTPVRWLKTTQEIVSVGKDMEKRNTCALIMGMQIGAATLENSMEFPQKIKK